MSTATVTACGGSSPDTLEWSLLRGDPFSLTAYIEDKGAVAGWTAAAQVRDRHSTLVVTATVVVERVDIPAEVVEYFAGPKVWKITVSLTHTQTALLPLGLLRSDIELRDSGSVPETILKVELIVGADQTQPVVP